MLSRVTFFPHLLAERPNPIRVWGLDNRGSLNHISRAFACPVKGRSGGMADALDSKSSDRKIVWVQVPPPVLTRLTLSIYTAI
jgi:hypothetical protein